MEQTIRSSIVKLSNWEKLSIRKRIERFNSREQEQDEDFELQLMPLDSVANLILCSIGDEAGFHFETTLHVDNTVADFKCKLWLENLAGEKCSEIEFDKNDYDDADNGLFMYDIVFDFGRFDPRQFFIDDVAIVCFEISYYVSSSDYDLDFRRNLWQTLEAGIFDVVLKVDGKDIKASKSVLAAQSRVFKCMFTSNSVEAQTGIVEITDFTYEAVEAFVEFMYLNATDKLEVLTKELYVLADFYDVQLLKYRCVKQLNGTICDENVLGRLIMAFTYNDSELKKPALEHIVDKTNAVNCFTMMVSREWAELVAKNSCLAEEISAAIFSQHKD